MRRLTALMALVIACSITGCFLKAVHESDFIGMYEALLPDGGSETLELLEGGKCKQVIKLHDGKVYESIGTWDLSFPHNWPHLIFKGIRSPLTALHELDPDIAKEPFGVLGKGVTPSWTGKPMINFTEDSYYRKVR